MVPILYRDFWDVPRMILARHHGTLVLLDCPFDEAAEDYGAAYRVYAMPELTDEQRAGSWAGFPRLAARHLGNVPVERVRFDPTRRRSFDAAVLDELLAAAPP